MGVKLYSNTESIDMFVASAVRYLGNLNRIHNRQINPLGTIIFKDKHIPVIEWEALIATRNPNHKKLPLGTMWHLSLDNYLGTEFIIALNARCSYHIPTYMRNAVLMHEIGHLAHEHSGVERGLDREIEADLYSFNNGYKRGITKFLELLPNMSEVISRRAALKKAANA